MSSAPQLKEMTFGEAIRDATAEAMRKDPRVFVVGLGAPDPKGIFGTTLGLVNEFGEHRVMDAPVSENALTGLVVGAALGGLKPILTHQRVDFALLSLDQLVNQAAKWHYMFDGRAGSVPLVVRLVIGRGWGQGPQHAQSLAAWFAHVPGLKVVAPATPSDAKGLLLAAIEDPNPVVYLEHRWLHGMKGPVPQGYFPTPLQGCRVGRAGADLTLVASSHMTAEAMRAADFAGKLGLLDIEVVDVRCLKPLDRHTILTSVRKTGRLVVADDDAPACGLAAEVMASVFEEGIPLKAAPVRVTHPDCPSPSAPNLAAAFYPTAKDLFDAALRVAGKPPAPFPQPVVPSDVPDRNFPGPF